MRNVQKLSMLLAATLAVGTCGTAAFAAPNSKAPAVKVPQNLFVPDQMLVMKNAGADSDEINQAISDMNGTIVQTINYGKMTAYVVNVPKGTMEDNMRKVQKDKEHFDSVQRNWISHPAAAGVANDPLLANQWHIAALNTPAAWQETGTFQLGAGTVYGVLDTGCQSGLTEIPNMTPGATIKNGTATVGQTDTGTPTSSGTFYHGTFVTGCTVAQTNNGFLGSSPASGSKVVPIDVYAGAATTTDANILAGLSYIQNKNPNTRIVNLSSQQNPPASFANPQAHPVLFQAFKAWYNAGNLLFNASGNSALQDTSARTPYVIMVSAINEQCNLASFSNYGTPLWFTAPGQDILSAYINDTSTTASGTSFASPLAAGVALSILSKTPTMTNVAVLNKMSSTANTNLFAPHGIGSHFALYFGYGEPDQGACLQ